MKIVFHENYLPQYDDTPAGDSNRLEPTLALLSEDPSYEFVTPGPAPLQAVKRAHSDGHIRKVENNFYGHGLYDISLLGAGGAIMCADIAAKGAPAFGLLRPPGHHASGDSCWGFCYFNNVAVSLLHARDTYGLVRGLVLDFDLHTGDGNINILRSISGYEIINPAAPNESEYLHEVELALENAAPADIIAASAGFDQGISDWGGLLSPEGYFQIGMMMKKYSRARCGGRRYALLEGGYNFTEMAWCIKAFCEGFRD